MTNGELKDIKILYEEITKAREEIEKLEEAIEIYEQNPVVKHYIALKKKLEIDKAYCKSHYGVKKLSDDELLENVVRDIGATSTNNIYVFMDTHVKNEIDRTYINIESLEKIQISCTLQAEFEQKNIVLYPPKEVDSSAYLTNIINMYFKTATKYGQEQAVEKILEERDTQTDYLSYLKKLSEKNPEEAKKVAMYNLIKTGIIDENGELESPYNGENTNSYDFTRHPKLK